MVALLEALLLHEQHAELVGEVGRARLGIAERVGRRLELRGRPLAARLGDREALRERFALDDERRDVGGQGVALRDEGVSLRDQGFALGTHGITLRHRRLEVRGERGALLRPRLGLRRELRRRRVHRGSGLTQLRGAGVNLRAQRVEGGLGVRDLHPLVLLAGECCVALSADGREVGFRRRRARGGFHLGGAHGRQFGLRSVEAVGGGGLDRGGIVSRGRQGCLRGLDLGAEGVDRRRGREHLGVQRLHAGLGVRELGGGVRRGKCGPRRRRVVLAGWREEEIGPGRLRWCGPANASGGEVAWCF